MTAFGGTTSLADEKDSVEEFFASVYSMLENPVALYDEEYECLHSNDHPVGVYNEGRCRSICA